MAAPVAVLIHSAALTFGADTSQALGILCSWAVMDFVKVIVGDAKVCQSAWGECQPCSSSGVKKKRCHNMPKLFGAKWRDERKGSSSYICIAVTL